MKSTSDWGCGTIIEQPYGSRGAIVDRPPRRLHPSADRLAFLRVAQYRITFRQTQPPQAARMTFPSQTEYGGSAPFFARSMPKVKIG